MCGFAGFITTRSHSTLSETGRSMADAIVHRGPDDSGVWADDSVGVCLSHRRLSIIDLSAAGHQPMLSASGRFVLAFNGEIYNHQDIRQQLQDSARAPTWRGHSDTETLLAAFEAFGVETTLKLTVGMFAIALWDRQTQTLTLARDRFGEKPLYYGWASGAFLFGSELKALRAHPGFDNLISPEALDLYMRFSYVPAPHTIHRHIFKLEPGCSLQLQGQPGNPPSHALRAPATEGNLSLSRWWSLSDAVVAGAANPIQDETEAIECLAKQLGEAVKLQSLADVPLGAFLSGGIDSSTIVALMQTQSSRPVKTFTIGFEDSGYDESPHAAAVARHLGTDHSELFVTATQTLAVIPQLPQMYDEPFADSSQIPTHLVCRAARQQVTVALSGDAGDELFGGYTRYFWGPRIWNRLALLPYPVRRALGAFIQSIPIALWDATGSSANALLRGSQGIRRVGDKVHKLASRLKGVGDLEDLYLSLVTEWQTGDCVLRTMSLSAKTVIPGDPLPASGVEDSQSRMMYRDTLSYLPDDILCKVDRAAMATSLETRVPFLDHRVAELAWRLPLHMKLREGQGKWILRQLLYRHVPRELIERPKAGFGIPVGQWLRGPLRDWAEDLLSAPRLETEGHFNPAPIRKRWAEHLSGQRDHTNALWSVLMFQAWLGQIRGN